jgi:acetylornithine deacetylase/succinyl-diaminopimelate desuccinylase-like protein
MATDLYAALEHAIPATREEFETLLRELVQIPTVSMDPAHTLDIQQGAHKAAAILQACGATVDIVETPGNPVVFGQLTVNPGPRSRCWPLSATQHNPTTSLVGISFHCHET